MQRKFQYVLMGAGLTLLVIFGALTLLLPPAQASNSFSVPADDPRANEKTSDVTIEDRTSSPEIRVVENLQTNGNISETISKETDSRPELSTKENPETDIAKIIEQLGMLAEKNEARLFGEPGWLYVKHESYWPLKYMSNTGDIYGIPVTELYGTDTVTHEEWYEVDAQGYFQQKIGQITDANGITRNQWAISNGYFIALSLNDATEQAISPHTTNSSALPVASDFSTLLEMAQNEGHTITAWYAADQYVLVYTKTLDEPKTNYAGELVQRSQVKYQFNLETGAIQLFEVTDQLTNGEWIVKERSVLLEQYMVENLPTAVEQTLNEAATLVEEK